MSDTQPNATGTLPTNVAQALDEELGRLEELKATGWLVLGALIAVGGVIAGVAIDGDIVQPALSGAVLIWIWFGAVRWGLRRRRLRAWQRRATLVVECGLPWLNLAGMTNAAGPEIALSSWSTLLFFGAIMMLTLLRLSPRQSLAYGLIGAVLYTGIAFRFTRPQLDPARWELLGVTDSDLVVRGACIALAGVLCAFVARGLRTAFGSAVRVARARDLFGKYRLERELAAGGMGTVWLATYAPEGGFRRPAAVKKIHPHLAREERFVDAFRKEAELGARLVHHNIVQVLDFGRIDDAYFLAMEYVDGCSCAELSKRAAAFGVGVSPRIVARIGRGVLSGLAYAHADARDVDGAPLRVVHRDLAPQNVLVSTAGLVKITDFGIARTLKDHTSALTKAVGHAGHVAPEHLDAQPIDARSDLFLVGILLWELLCSRPLFVKESEMATLNALLLQPAPPPSSVDAKLAPWDAFLARALEKDPAKRYGSAAEMAAALEELIERGGVGVASGEELGGLVRALAGKDLHDAPTVPLGGRVGTPNDDVTEHTPQARA